MADDTPPGDRQDVQGIPEPEESKSARMEIRIRPFEREDMDPLYFLDRRCVEPAEAIAYERWLTALLERESLALVAVEEMEARPQPMLGCLVVRADPARSSLNVLTLMVDPDFRRIGLGRTLMAWAGQIARSRSLREVAVVQEGDPAATEAFLSGCGFQRTEEIAPGFRLPEPRPRWTRPIDNGSTEKTAGGGGADAHGDGGGGGNGGEENPP